MKFTHNLLFRVKFRVSISPQARAPDSVVIIVGTFYDQLTAQQKKSGFVERMHKLINQQYVGKDLDGGIVNPRERGLPKVVRVIDVSCTTGHHINILREMIYTAALEIKGPGEFPFIPGESHRRVLSV